MEKNNEETLRRRETNNLRVTFGAVKIDGRWRIRTNKELEDLIINEVKIGGIRWLAHVHRVEDARIIKQFVKGI